MWEYDRFEIKFNFVAELIKELNKIGNDNWEIINYEEIKSKKNNENTCIIIVKRQKKSGIL